MAALVLAMAALMTLAGFFGPAAARDLRLAPLSIAADALSSAADVMAVYRQCAVLLEDGAPLPMAAAVSLVAPGRARESGAGLALEVTEDGRVRLTPAADGAGGTVFTASGAGERGFDPDGEVGRLLAVFGLKKLRILDLSAAFVEQIGSLSRRRYFQGDIPLEDLLDAKEWMARLANRRDGLEKRLAAYRGPDPEALAGRRFPALDLKMGELIRAAAAGQDAEGAQGMEDSGAEGDAWALGSVGSPAAVHWRLSAAYDAHKETLDDVIRQVYERERLRERLRRMAVGVDFPVEAEDGKHPAADADEKGAEALSAALLLRDLLAAEYALLDAMEACYLGVVRIREMAGVSDFGAYVAAAPIAPEGARRVRAGRRALVIRAADFNRRDTAYLVRLMVVKNIEEAIFPAEGEGLDPEKREAFVRLAAAAGIRDYPMSVAALWASEVGGEGASEAGGEDLGASEAGGEDRAIRLSCRDFSDEAALEARIDALALESGVHRFIIDDLSGYEALITGAPPDGAPPDGAPPDGGASRSG